VNVFEKYNILKRSKMKKTIGAVCILILLTGISNIYPAGFDQKIGVVEKLGNQIPLNVSFTDSDGKTVMLKDLINKPTVIDLAYYKCTGICTPLMTEIAGVINKVDLIAGKDYNIVTISINDNEFPKDAASKKAEMMNLVNSEIPDNAWRFLTGDSSSIAAVTSAVGFNFQRLPDGTFTHTGILIFVSSDGKICRYLKPDYDNQGNFRILPFDFKMAILEASKGQAIPVINNVVKYCFSYQPKSDSYTFNLFKVFGTGTLVVVAIVFVFVVLRPGKKHKKIS
jgi:protein SCO1/2